MQFYKHRIVNQWRYRWRWLYSRRNGLWEHNSRPWWCWRGFIGESYSDARVYRRWSRRRDGWRDRFERHYSVHRWCRTFYLDMGWYIGSGGRYRKRFERGGCKFLFILFIDLIFNGPRIYVQIVRFEMLSQTSREIQTYFK